MWNFGRILLLSCKIKGSWGLYELLPNYTTKSMLCPATLALFNMSGQQLVIWGVTISGKYFCYNQCEFTQYSIKTSLTKKNVSLYLKHINSAYVKLANWPVTLAHSANVNIYFKILSNPRELAQGGYV